MYSIRAFSEDMDYILSTDETRNKTRLTNYQHHPSLDGQSQLRTMAYGWTHDVDGYYSIMFHLMLYYPDRGYKRAVHLFRQENQLTRGLLDALKNIGHTEQQRILTPLKYKSSKNILENRKGIGVWDVELGMRYSSPKIAEQLPTAML